MLLAPLAEVRFGVVSLEAERFTCRAVLSTQAERLNSSTNHLTSAFLFVSDHPSRYQRSSAIGSSNP